MSCEKCGCSSKRMGLCPISFGLALGLTSFLAILTVVLIAIHYGTPTPMMDMMHMAVPTFKTGLIHAGYGFVKGFIFGFVLALIYDLIIKICKCCKKKGDGTSCQCQCGVSDKKIEMKV